MHQRQLIEIKPVHIHSLRKNRTVTVSSGKKEFQLLPFSTHPFIANHPQGVSRWNDLSAQLASARQQTPQTGTIVVHSLKPFHLSRFFTSLGKLVTLDFLPKAVDLEEVKKADALNQTLRGSLGHATLAYDNHGNAFLLQLQGNSKGDFAPTRYQNALGSLFVHAVRYAQENGLQLHVFHPKVYLHINRLSSQEHMSSSDEQTLQVVYGRMRRLAKRIFTTAEGQAPLPTQGWGSFLIPEIRQTLTIT